MSSFDASRCYRITQAPNSAGHVDITIGAPDVGTAQTATQSIATVLGMPLQLFLPGSYATPVIYSPAGQGGTVSAPTGVEVWK